MDQFTAEAFPRHHLKLLITSTTDHTEALRRMHLVLKHEDLDPSLDNWHIVITADVWNGAPALSVEATHRTAAN